ncbi:tol-pal system-associated acyl-CoA thioesterase [Isoalcanivorax beigongshangi]|uniref:Tol-pal system-associated acyl-CoA thioesterase n=1 Tax=Isoalcanivorax beigongshangi TaxID=3238810 RepID=A0ABV4AK33_9GAMM
MTEPNQSPAPFRLPVRVYIEDTDAGGIVYYVNYLKFMERARTEYMRGLGSQHYLLAEQDIQFVVHSCDIRYRRPARIDDALDVTAAIHRISGAALHFTQTVQRGTELLCEATVKVACVQASTLQPCALPPALRQALNTDLQQRLEGEAHHAR